MTTTLFCLPHAGGSSSTYLTWKRFLPQHIVLRPIELPGRFSRIIRIQRKLFFFDVILLASRALILISGGMYLSAGYTILLFSTVSAFMNIAFIIIVGFLLMRKEGQVGFNLAMDDVKE